MFSNRREGRSRGHGVRINTALIEWLNSVERRLATETGQEVDRQDINLRGKLNDESEVLKKAFSCAELEAMRARMQAVIDAEQGGRHRRRASSI